MGDRSTWTRGLAHVRKDWRHATRILMDNRHRTVDIDRDSHVLVPSGLESESLQRSVDADGCTFDGMDATRTLADSLRMDFAPAVAVQDDARGATTHDESFGR